MITTASRTAHADQLHAEVRDARSYDGHAASCDALDPCSACKAKTREVRVARLFGQEVPEIPAPRVPSPLVRRLALR